MIPVIFALAVSIATMIALMRVFGFHPFFSLLIAALLCGLFSGQNFADILSAMQSGFGNLLAQIGFIVTLGSCLGMMMEKTGAMEALSLHIVEALGQSRAIGSMTVIGLVIGIPVFCDSGFIILSRLIPGIAAQAAVAPGQLALALSSGLYTTHVLVPPTPGPLAAATTYGLGSDMGIMISIGVLASMPVGLVALVFARRLGREISQIAVAAPDVHRANIPLWQALLPIILPILLIAIAPATSLIPAALPLRPALNILGHPVIALSIGLMLAFIPLLSRPRSQNVQPVRDWMMEAIKDAGVILLITGAGGAFGSVIKASGVDDLLRDQFGSMQAGGVVILLVAYLVAAILKTAQGSSTSSMIITSSLIAPLALGAGFAGPVQFSALVLATGAGAMTVSHANDSYFWVVSQFGKISASDMLRTFTLVTALQGGTALVVAVTIYLLA
jgi:GntP family gluconate:H+ symporter